jgi:dTDP-4-dehydrorhamnose reductase
VRILITGHGMLGSALEAASLRRGHEVTVHSTPDDVTDADAVRSWMVWQPELVFHTAALTKVNYCEEHPHEAERVNGEGTRNVVEAAAEIGARLVYFSTDYVFPGGAAEPVVEGAAPKPLNAYGASKLSGEVHVAASELGHIVRISGVFGPRDNGQERNFFRAIYEKLTAGTGPIEVVDDQFTAVSYAPHLAEMLFSLLPELPKETHLTSAGQNSWYGWARELVRAAGAAESRIVPVPTDSGSPVVRPRYSVLGTRHLHVANIIRQYPAINGIAAYVQYLRGLQVTGTGAPDNRGYH